MLQVICPRCGNVHHADEIHVGKLLRCSQCGDAVQISSKAPGESDRVITVEGKRASQSTRSSPVSSTSKDLLDGIWAKLDRLWIIGLLSFVTVATIFVVAVNYQQSDPPPLKATRSSSTPDIFDAVQSHSPISKTPETQNPVGTRQNRSLATGTRIERDRGNVGNGLLTIENFSGADAVVKVFSETTGRIGRFVFVQDRTKATLKGMPPDEYKIRFKLGSDWDADIKTFTHTLAFFEFGKDLTFTEEELEDRTVYSHHSITLNTVPDGNVSRRTIDQGEFDTECISNCSKN